MPTSGHGRPRPSSSRHRPPPHPPQLQLPHLGPCLTVCRGWRRLALLAGPPLEYHGYGSPPPTPSLICDSLFDLRSTRPCRPHIAPLTSQMVGIIRSHGQYILCAVHVFSGRVWFVEIVLYNPFTGQFFQLPLLPLSPETSVSLGRLSSIPHPCSKKDSLYIFYLYIK